MKRVLASGLAALMSATTVVAVSAGAASALPPVSTTPLNVKPLELSENGGILEYASSPKVLYRDLATNTQIVGAQGGLMRGNGRWILDAELIRFGSGLVTQDKIIIRDRTNAANDVTLVLPAALNAAGYQLIALEDLSSNGQVVIFRVDKVSVADGDSRLFAWNKAAAAPVELDAGLTRSAVIGVGATSAPYHGAVDAELNADGTKAIFYYKDAYDGCTVPGSASCVHDVYVTPTTTAAGRKQVNVGAAGTGTGGYVSDIAISGDGNTVAFEAFGFALGTAAGEFANRLYVRNLSLGDASTELVSTRGTAVGQVEVDLSVNGDRVSYFSATGQPRVRVRSINKTIDLNDAATSMTMSDDGLWLAYATSETAGVLVKLPVDASEPYFQKRLKAGEVVEMPIAGKTGVPADASAAVLNVTAVGPGGNGYLTVWPCGIPNPGTSSLNYTAGQDTPNLVVSKIGTGGMVCVFTSEATDVLIDLNGYFPAGGDFRGIAPDRKLDTRAGVKPASGSITEATVVGKDVPLDAAAVVLNMTATGTDGSGYITVWPCGQDRPDASTLNFQAGQDRANMAVAKVGAGGKVCLFTSAPTHMIVDVVGYFPAGSNMTPLVPDRLLDTRKTSAVVGGQFTRITVPAGNKAVALNITVTGATGPGYATVWPCGETQPNASNLNFGAGQDVPNAVIAKVGTNNQVCLFTIVTANYIADINAAFPASSSFVPLAPIRRFDTR
jgi:hypothetical protein